MSTLAPLATQLSLVAKTDVNSPASAKDGFSIRNVALSIKSFMGSRSARIDLAIARNNPEVLAELYRSVELRSSMATERRTESKTNLTQLKSRYKEAVIMLPRCPALSYESQKAQNKAKEEILDMALEVRLAETELKRCNAKAEKYENQSAAINERLDELGFDWHVVR